MAAPAEVPLPAALRPYVASRVAYDVDLGAPGVHRGLPGTTLTFVLPVGERLRVRWASGDPHEAWSSLAGLHDAPAQIVHGGVQQGVQLGLTLAGARALLGVPAGSLAGALTDLEEAAPALRTLPERLHDLATWEERQRLVDSVLRGALRRRQRAGEARAEVGRALAALTRGHSVAAVADDIGYSRRRLGTLVRDECGLSPKAYQRVARFERSRRVLGRHGTSVRLADVAHHLGYADQSHLSRDWVDLAGCAPSVWLREEFPFLQAGEGPAAASSPA